MILLFDIDSLLYSSTYGVETEEEAIHKFDEAFQKTCNDVEDFYEVEEIICFGLSKYNYRKGLTRNAEKKYKANRQTEKPPFFDQLCNYVREYYEPEIACGMETDDLVVLYQRKIGHENCIIVSIDKDYLQCEGTIYNYRKREFIKVTQQEALYNFYEQMIVGDTADNVNYCKGYGKKYTQEAFKGVVSEFGYRRKVLSLFKEIYGKKARERFIECYHLLRLGHLW